MSEHDDELDGRAATIDPNNQQSHDVSNTEGLFSDSVPDGAYRASLEQQRKKYSRMLSEGFDGSTEEQHADSQNRSSSEFSRSAPGASTQSHGRNENAADVEDETDKVAKPELLSVKNVLILFFGIAAPLLVSACWGAACYDRVMLLLLKHPVEFVVEALLTLNIPLANYFIWRATSRRDLRFPLRNGLLIGMSAGTALIIAACAATAVALGYAVMDLNNDSRSVLFSIIAFTGFASAGVSIFQALELRNLREFRSARKMSMLFSLGGLIAALLVLVGAEARPFLVRIAESNATSDKIEERDTAIDNLKRLDAEKDLRMECSDQRAAGIPGMFIKLDPTMQRQVYFMLTGKPFRDSKASDYSAMPDEYLRRHVVGAPIENLSLARSAMTGTIDSDKLTSAINWTFVLKNRDYKAQEGRAEIVLPHGAVINGVSQLAGEGSMERQAHVGLASQNRMVSYDSLAGSDVTDLGRDRILLRLPNIAPQSETKLTLSIASPMTLNDLSSASLTLPKFADCNFNMQSENAFRLRSRTKATLDGKSIIASKTADGEFLLAGNLKGDELNDMNMTIDAQRNPDAPGAIGYRDHATGLVITRTIVPTVSNIPNSLMVVIDASASMKDHIQALADALKKLPSSITTSVLIASTDKTFSSEPLSLQDALAKIKNSKESFVGGQDNLQTVVKAAGIAGESKNGAVLWIHGPQAGLNKELYITAPYAATPRFYEISVDKGANDASELFKNHREIGPFTTVTRSNDIAADLKHFIAKWQPGGSGYEVKYGASSTMPENVTVLPANDSKEFVSIGLKQEYDSKIKSGNTMRAGQLAYAGNIVTPDTSAVISVGAPHPAPHAVAAVTNQPVPDTFGAPSLQGATNGTIGPQGLDATYITGVNTAGTVRVNNLANLEAALNIFCNTFELLGVLAGGALVLCSTLTSKMPSIFGTQFSRRQAAVMGVTMVLVGLMIPGTVNWFVASARDANLFE